MAMQVGANPQLPDSDRIEYGNGMMGAMLTFVAALIELQPDLERFSRAWVEAAELQLVTELAHTSSEPYLLGQEEIRGRIAELIQFERQRRGG